MVLERYGIELIVGKREAGKTTFGVMDFLRKLNTGIYVKGYSNIHIYTDATHKKLDPRVKFVKYEQLYKIVEPSPNGVPTAFLYLDQLHKYLDSRQPHCKRNKYMNDLAIEARQHGLDWIGTTWAKSSVDLRVRKFSPMTIQAWRNQRQKRFEYVFTEEDSVRVRMKQLPWNKAQKWWDLFDTSELVEDIPADWDPRPMKVVA